MRVLISKMDFPSKNRECTRDFNFEIYLAYIIVLNLKNVLWFFHWKVSSGIVGFSFYIVLFCSEWSNLGSHVTKRAQRVMQMLVPHAILCACTATSHTEDSFHNLSSSLFYLAITAKLSFMLLCYFQYLLSARAISSDNLISPKFATTKSRTPLSSRYPSSRLPPPRIFTKRCSLSKTSKVETLYAKLGTFNPLLWN